MTGHVNVYLVRHAKAGDRTAWEGDDRARPLTGRGRRQAERLVETLRCATFGHIVSSPYVRCIQTVVPLASSCMRSIEVSDALAEGASLDAAIALVSKYADDGAVLSTHGDVVPMVLGHLKATGVAFDTEPTWPKGSTWALRCEAGEVVRATYMPPPD